MPPRTRELELDDAFEGALMVSPSWVFAGLSAAGLYGTLRVLRARSWEGVTGERRSRLPRPLLAPLMALSSRFYFL